MILDMCTYLSKCLNTYAWECIDDNSTYERFLIFKGITIIEQKYVEPFSLQIKPYSNSRDDSVDTISLYLYLDFQQY